MEGSGYKRLDQLIARGKHLCNKRNSMTMNYTLSTNDYINYY